MFLRQLFITNKQIIYNKQNNLFYFHPSMDILAFPVLFVCPTNIVIIKIPVGTTLLTSIFISSVDQIPPKFGLLNKKVCMCLYFLFLNVYVLLIFLTLDYIPKEYMARLPTSSSTLHVNTFLVLSMQ